MVRARMQFLGAIDAVSIDLHSRKDEPTGPQSMYPFPNNTVNVSIPGNVHDGYLNASGHQHLWLCARQHGQETPSKSEGTLVWRQTKCENSCTTKLVTTWKGRLRKNTSPFLWYSTSGMGTICSGTSRAHLRIASWIALTHDWRTIVSQLKRTVLEVGAAWSSSAHQH